MKINTSIYDIVHNVYNTVCIFSCIFHILIYPVAMTTKDAPYNDMSALNKFLI